MDQKIDKVIQGSKIISFFGNLNKILVVSFCNSKTCKLFTKINSFFRNTILVNIDRSKIVKSVKKIALCIGLRDVGIFIILIVLFNTLAMMALGKEIDMFSVSARIFFFIIGVACVWNMRLRKK